MKKIAVFASGNGSNFEALAAACARKEIDAEIALMVCDKPGAYVCERAAKYGVDTFVFKPKSYASKEAFEKEIADRLDACGVELVCLAGYMRIIGSELLSRYGGRIVNIHPALLPSFPGAHAIRDSFDFGVKVFGVTIHYVDATLDGGKIISQAPVTYYGNDIDELETRIHAVEHRLYVATVNHLLAGTELPVIA